MEKGKDDSMKNKVKRIFFSVALIFALIICNGCYWMFSDIQTQCVEKISRGQQTSLYEKASIASLHMGICTLGALYCPEAAWANFKMLVTDKDTIYMHSDKWITPKVRARLEMEQWGKMVWNGDTDYAFESPEKNGAILLNWCMLGERVIDSKPCYVAECDYTWKVPSKTTFKITDKIEVVLYEQLFYELEKIGLLHSFKLVCYYEK